MSLTFPTRPRGPSLPGRPERAHHCRCGSQRMVLEPGTTCTRCGHYPNEVIQDTWQQRGRQIAAVAASRSKRKKAA